jgi:PAS domain S-box-containing protein
MSTKHTYEELERRVKQLEKKGLEQKRLKDALSDSEGNYRHLVENIPEVIYSVDTHGVMTYVSPAVESLVGYRSEEIIGRPFADFIFPQDLPRMKKHFQKALTGNVKPAEYRIMKKSNGYRWVRTFSKPIFVKDVVVAIQGILMDVTESKKIEEALRESEAQKKAILDGSVDRIRLVDTDLRIIWANKTTTRELNMAPEDLVGQPCYKVLFDSDTPCSECPSTKAVTSGNIEHNIMHHRHSKGIEGETYWDNYAVPVKNESGDIVNLIQIARNITDQVQGEQALKEREEELKIKTANLEEMNIAMKVLLKQQEEAIS